MALTLKNKLFDYFAQRHFDLMTPEVRARFDEYANNEDFQGHMKHWNDNYNGAILPDLLSGTIGGGANDYQLSDTEWEELYDVFQEAFQAMNSAKTPSVGFEGPYKKATKDFITKYFGDSSKIFTTTTATSILTDPTNGLFTRLANFLDPRTAQPTAEQANQYSALKNLLSTNLKEQVFSDGLDYDGFIDGLRKQKYNTDLDFRKKIERVIYYIKQNGPQQDEMVPRSGEWPRDVGYTSVPQGQGIFTADKIDPFLSDIYDPNNAPDNTARPWYSLDRKAQHISQFKSAFWEISDILLTKSGVRSDFTAKAPDTIAIESTDYTNKESKDYVPEKYPDEKNWKQELEDWKNDTYENYFRKFVNPSRGARIYLSPWPQNIIKAFDKAKIKPTDGIEGILAKKGDISDKLKSSKTSTDHFNWFTDTIEKLKAAGMGKSVEGALRNGAQMRALVSALIVEAVKQGKIKEAKTALEVLSVAKYGLSCSRTVDAIREGTKDAKVFSDSSLSWNKNEGIQFVTNAIDKTARAALIGVSAGIAGINNFIQHRRTKIGNDISKNKVLNDAHKKWEQEDQQALQNKQAENRHLNVDMKLNTLTSGQGLSGLVINETTIGDDATPGTIKGELKIALDNGNPTLTINGTTVNTADLKADVELYDDAKSKKDEESNWRKNHKDQYQELIAYWDMLETLSKTHSFTLGSMAAKRKAMLNGYGNGTSLAQTQADAYIANYGALRTV